MIFFSKQATSFFSRPSKEVRSSPTCSVLIKYLPEVNDVVFGHNSWFEYRSMAYRYIGTRYASATTFVTCFQIAVSPSDNSH